MGMIELTKEVSIPRQRQRGSLVLGLCLLGAGYWTVGQSITLYHKGIRAAVTYAITNDIAQTGLQGKHDDRIIYQTAMQLDRCMESLESVRQSIEPLPLGGPQTEKR
jgi:hypothetical protein